MKPGYFLTALIFSRLAVGVVFVILAVDARIELAKIDCIHNKDGALNSAADVAKCHSVVDEANTLTLIMIPLASGFFVLSLIFSWDDLEAIFKSPTKSWREELK